MATGMRHQYDLVACVGYGKNSSVSTIRTTVKPQVRARCCFRWRGFFL